MNKIDTIDRASLRSIAAEMGRSEVTHLVTTYYQIQEFRKAAMNMVGAQKRDGRPHELVQWVGGSQQKLENDIKSLLSTYAKAQPPGQWLLSQHGIGPVITAGLLAHIDISRAPTAGHIWSYAGLNPNQVWRKGEKRPWNAELKTLCYKIGDSFVKTSNSDKSFYGPVYRLRKEQEMERNENGNNAEASAQILLDRNIKEVATRQAYESGKLPLGHVDMRARRYVVKLFLSHLHDVLTWLQYARRAPRPYAFDHLGHAHMIECPMPPWGSIAREQDNIIT